MSILVVLAASLWLASAPASPAPQRTPSEALAEARGFYASRQNASAAFALVDTLVDDPSLTPREHADATHVKGWALVVLGRSKAAAPLLEQARAEYMALGDVQERARAGVELGAAMHELKDDVAAASVAADAAAGFESAGNMRGRVDALADQILYMPPDQKAPLAAEGIALAQTLGAQFPEGRIRHSLADGLYSTGDFAGAVRELGLAVACFHAVGPAATGALARAYTSLGRAQRAHGLPAEALASYRAALPLQQALHDLRGMTQTWNATGVAWSHLGQKTRSLECYRHGLTIARELGDPVPVQFMEGAVASGLLELRRYREAAAQFEAVLDKPLDPTIARYRWEGLANAYLGLARPGDARRAVDRSLEPTSAPLLDLLPSQLLTRAKADVALGDDEMALQDARKGLDVLERTRQGLLPLDFVKQGYSDRYAEYFAFTIDVLERGGRSAEAVGVAEEARARGFADLLATRDAEARNAPVMGQSSTAEVEGSARLLTQGAVPAASTGPAPDEALISPVTTAPLDAAGLAAQARRLHAPIVSYWLGASSSYVWVVGEDGVVHGARLPLSRRRLTALVRRATDESLSALDVTSPAAVGAAGPAADPWRALHDVLIAPISRWLPPSGSRLAIIPHDVLFSLPFAALRDARGHYFVERYAFIVAPSASVLQLSSNRAPVPEGRPWLIVADPRTAPDAHLPPLPGARVEARVVAAAAPSGVRQLEGRDATLPAVITAMAGASLVHIAAHAVADDGKTGAYIALASNEREAAVDSRLTASRIYGLRLDAELVVLSACRSARGPISGDGVAGFGRAFIYAGARAVVVSLWDVPDAPAARLMKQFYARLEGGADRASALRDAQLSLLRALRRGEVSVTTSGRRMTLSEQPRLWAGFELLGEP